jgi:glycosyltransferase involved in cell wall biosynthesis
MDGPQVLSDTTVTQTNLEESPDVLIFLPAYNEEHVIGDVLDRVIKISNKLEDEAGGNFDVLLIDDGSSDKSLEEARQRDVLILPHPRNLGPGVAAQSGYKFAVRNGYDMTVRLDADGQHPPEEIPKLVHPVLSGDADVAVGNRFKLEDSYDPRGVRRIGIMFYSRLVSLLTGDDLSDVTSGFRAARIEVGQDHARELRKSMNAIDRGLREGLRDFEVQEISVRMEVREHGTSYLTAHRLAIYPLVSIYAVISALWRSDEQ